MTTIWFERGSRIVLLAVVIGIAATVTRDFARYTDYFPYIAVDDSLGNVSYNLATQGNYGFPVSPVQGFANIPRHRNFSNYGPWYFYAGAGLIWLFGYSVALLRSLHLIGILVIAATACWWFGRRGRIAPGALIALGLLYSFDVGQWPMVRPDIAVSVFAVMFIVAAGLAIESGSNTAWFFGALAAGCAAFTHLIAWALVPCCLFTLAIALVNDRPGKQRALVALVVVGAGLFAAAAMFYASFGFRIRDHLLLLRGYGGFLSTAVAGGNSGSPLATHLGLGFWYVGPAGRIALASIVCASAGLVVASSRWSRALRTEAIAVLLPPVTVSCFYVASLTLYTNYHAGYEILPQVCVCWCAGALAFILLRVMERRVPASSHLFAAAAVLIVLVAGAIQFATRVRADSNPRLAYVREWVGIDDYIGRIGDLVNPGATAWGPPTFGIDSPGRFDLIDVGAALSIVELARISQPVDSERVAPAYLIWGYVNNRENTLQALNATYPGNDFGRVGEALVPVRYRLIGLVAAAPYGVTRVYQRVLPSDNKPQRMPVVSAYNSTTRLWDSHVEGPLPAPVTAAEPTMFDLRYGPLKEIVRADRTVKAELPEGRYLLRVRLGGASRSNRPTVVAVTSAPSISEQVGDLGPSIDFSPYVEGDADAYLIHTHPGGALYVSQFDKGQKTSLEGLDAYRILPALHDDQRPDHVFATLSIESWATLTSAGVARITEARALAVQGDATAAGFQIASPVVPATPHSTVTLRTSVTMQQGHVCLGALNKAGAWLATGGDPLRDFTFTVDATAGFQILFYNCNPAESVNAPSLFTVFRVRYAVREPGMYIDRLLTALTPAMDRAPIAASRVRSFPAGLKVSDAMIRIQTPFRSADVRYRASGVVDAGAGWRVNAQAEGNFVYLLQFGAGRVLGHRLVATGVLKSGGITIGLLRNEQWAASVNVTDPGPFVAVVEAPTAGATYAAVVSNDVEDGSLKTDVTLERIGWAPMVQ